MKVLGLCGGSGSGKGAVSAIFAELNIPAIDTDLVYRRITAGSSPCLKALVEEFGNILNADGSLDRRRLATIVFADDGEEKRQALNRISHRFILDEVRVWLADQKAKGALAAIVDAPLLFESGFDSECDKTIGVIADGETRLTRIQLRDGISREAAERRLAPQLSDEELIRLCDYVIQNNGSIDALRREVTRVAEHILKN